MKHHLPFALKSILLVCFIGFLLAGCCSTHCVDCISKTKTIDTLEIKGARIYITEATNQDAAELDPKKFVSVATISGEPKLARRLSDALRNAGITSIIEGSANNGISVPPDKRAQAIEVLKKDAELHKYWIEFSP